MTQLDRVELLFELGDFGANGVDLFRRYLLFPIAQEQSLDIIQFTGETLISRRSRAVRFRRLGGLERRDGRRNDRGENAQYFRRQTQVCNHRQTAERGEHSYGPRERRGHCCQKTDFESWDCARWSHSSRRCLIRTAAHSHFGCGAPSPVELAIAASALHR